MRQITRCGLIRACITPREETAAIRPNPVRISVIPIEEGVGDPKKP